MKKLLFTALLLLGFQAAIAQHITGKVTDPKGESLAFATVALLSSSDSSFVAATTTQDNGTFLLETNKKEGILMVSYIGYKNFYTPYKGQQLGVITLEEDSKMLEGVVVKANRLVNTANGYSFRPIGSGLEKTNKIQDMLAFLPGLTITDNKISLFDKYPVIYVNGLKITSQEELSALSPKLIDKVEVDYISIGEGANEKAGTLRITTKKEQNGGYSGSLSAIIDEMPKYGHLMDSPTFVFNASIGRWTFNYYANYTHQKLLADETNKYVFNSGKVTFNDSKTRSWLNAINTRLNISYELSKRATLALSEYVGNKDIKNKLNTRVTMMEGYGIEPKTFNNFLYSPESKFVQQTVGKYILQTDERGSNLEITADYYHRNYHLKQNQYVNDGLKAETKTHERINMYSIAPKLTQRFQNGKELKTGASYQYIHYNDATESLQNKVGAQKTYAYANLSGRIKKMMYGVGLTLQYNQMDVRTNGTQTIVDNTYLCPQANLAWAINPKRGTMLNFMYQHNVAEMPYSIVNSYKNFENPQHYTTGNPSLSTPTDHQFMARFAFNRHLSFMFMYDRVADVIYYQHGIDANDPSITWAKPANAKYERMMGAQVEYTCKPTKWWQTKVQAAALQDKFATAEKTITGKWGGKFWWNNNFNFSETFGGSLNGYWETAMTFENHAFRPVGNLNASLWKTLFNDKLRLSMESTLCGRGRKNTIYGDGFTSYYHNATHPTSFTLTAKWYFSGGKKVKQRHEAESIQEYKKIEERK